MTAAHPALTVLTTSLVHKKSVRSSAPLYQDLQDAMSESLESVQSLC